MRISPVCDYIIYGIHFMYIVCEGPELDVYMF